jgi:HAMP domain-containing protein/putative methionine-R-sulfoxide reductase with GAF domain
MTLLPLILIPFFVMGAAGYLRARDILQDQITTQLNTSISFQVDAIAEWASSREIRLDADAHRPIVEQTMLNLNQLTPGAPSHIRQADELRDLLDDLRTSRASVLFNHILLADAATNEILVSTLTDWEGETLDLMGTFDIQSEEHGHRTLTEFNDPLLAPEGMAVLSVVAIDFEEDGQVELLLVGVTVGDRINELLNQLESTLLASGIYNLASAESYLAIEPDIIANINPTTLSLTGTSAANHPIFHSGSADEVNIQEYFNLSDVRVQGGFGWVPGMGLGIAVELPQSDIFATIYSLGPFTVLLLVSISIVTVLVIIYASNRMLEPLGTLTEFSERISRGEWLHRVPEDRNDELGQLASAFNRMADDLSGMYRSLEDKVEERTRFIRTAADVARAVVATPNLDDLLRRTVDQIKESFDFYHVSIFLLDNNGEYAVLRESTGEVGQALKARNHRLKVGSQSIIGWVTENNMPRVASEVGEDPVHFRNELLPETRAEAAVPLQVGGRVMGALDVQSTEPEAFDESVIEVLQTLADQLCAAIQNADLAETSATVAQRARTLSEITTQLSGIMDVDEVLQTTGRALYQALGQPEIMIKLETESSSSAGYQETETRPVIQPDNGSE